MQGFEVMDFGRIWERVWRDLGRMLELEGILKGVLIMEDGKVLKDFGRWRDLEQILARSWNHLDSETILEGNVLKDLDRFEGFRERFGSNCEGFLKMAFGRLWVLEFGRGLHGFCRRQCGRIFKEFGRLWKDVRRNLKDFQGCWICRLLQFRRNWEDVRRILDRFWKDFERNVDYG